MVVLEEIFDIQYGNKFDLNKMTFDNPSVNFVGRSAKNNGVTSFVDEKETVKPFNNGLITVALGGSILASFVQVKKFYTGQNIVVLSAKKEMSINQKLYYCMAIRNNEFRFSAFGREANRTLKNLLVPSVDEIPEWVDGYDIFRFDDAPLPLEENNMGFPILNSRARLDEIFIVYNGIASTKIELYSDKRENSIAFVRPASTHQRTLSGFLDKKSVEKKHIYPKGTLFVSTNGEGSHSYSYVSTMEFVPNSDVSVLIPKEGMSVEEKIYYALCITKNRYRFSYGRKPKGKRLKSLILPKISDSDESEKIISFIRSLPFSSAI